MGWWLVSCSFSQCFSHFPLSLSSSNFSRILCKSLVLVGFSALSHQLQFFAKKLTLSCNRRKDLLEIVPFELTVTPESEWLQIRLPSRSSTNTTGRLLRRNLLEFPAIQQGKRSNCFGSRLDHELRLCTWQLVLVRQRHFCRTKPPPR